LFEETYKSKITYHKADKLTSILADHGDTIRQSVFKEGSNPDEEDADECSSRDELKNNILAEAQDR
jgi:hypothetical protein